MKKRDVINLIRYHTENNDAAFRNEAYNIAKDFDRSGDEQLAAYVIALLSDAIHSCHNPQVRRHNPIFSLNAPS